MVDNSDEVVIALAHKVDRQLRRDGAFALPKGERPELPARAHLDAAYALRDLVHYHISEKHLATAYASASETARTG